MTNVQLVQLLIGDTTAVLFTVAEIQGFLTLTAVGGVESVYAAAAAACMSLGTEAVLAHKMEKIGNYTIDRKGMAEMYRKLADSYELKDQETPAVGVFEQSWTAQNAIDIAWNDALRSS